MDLNKIIDEIMGAGTEASELDPEILRRVAKPSRYLGGELGQVKKDLTSVDVTVGLCYPDLYEIGMSHIGLKILYSVLNADSRTAAERVYAVGTDMEAEMRARSLPLRTLENRIPLSDLNVLGFTLQYELSYTNLLQVLDLGGIPLRSADRDASHPLVIAGGPCAFNAEPLAAIIDAVCLGDGEETVVAVTEAVRRWKQSGKSRQDLLWALTEIPGVYVPSFYTPHYHSDGRIAEIEAAPGLPPRILKAIVTDLSAAPYIDSTPVPFAKVVHDRVGVEIQRGCMRGCRFCQAGYIYRPERQRSPERVQELVRRGLASTGQEEYSLLSLSAGDYSCMEPLLTSLMDEHEKNRTSISLPSMRLETLTPGIMEQVGRVRKTSFTVAPEAASDRLRGVINKVIDEDVLIDMVGEVFSRGWRNLKFYFMLGLPTEQMEDLQAMVDLGHRCLSRAKRHTRQANITVSVSSFVPKSHTPFQWARQIELPEIRKRQDFLKHELRSAGLGFRYHDSRSSVMEGVFSRGDRKVGEALVRAYERGARLDGWQEHFSEEAWYGAFEDTGVSASFYNQRHRDVDEVFPWQHIDIGMKPEWLWEDWMDALEAGFVPDCTTEPCYDCGVCDHEVVHNRVFKTPEGKALHRFRKPYGGSRKKEDPAFVAMPRPPGKKSNNVVDAVPPMGMSPGSAGARGTRAAHEAKIAAGEAPAPGQARSKLVPTGHEASRTQHAGLDELDWATVFDTRLPVEQRIKLEIRYGKTGTLVHLGHLEVMGAVRRALRRIEAPVLWSQGFHPQPKMTFGPPLPTSMASVAEWMDLELKRPLDVATFGRLLSEAMPEGLPILGVTEVPVERKPVGARAAGFVYRVTAAPAQHAEMDALLLRWAEPQPWVVEVEKKGVTKSVDLRDVVQDLVALEPGTVELTVAAIGAGARIRDVLKGIFGEAAALQKDGWSTLRTATLFGEGPPKKVKTGKKNRGRKRAARAAERSAR